MADESKQTSGWYVEASSRTFVVCRFNGSPAYRNCMQREYVLSASRRNAKLFRTYAAADAHADKLNAPAPSGVEKQA